MGQHTVLPRADDMTIPVGGPAECAAEIRTYAEATGATDMIFRCYWPGMDHAAVLRTLRLLGEKVWPLV